MRLNNRGCAGTQVRIGAEAEMRAREAALAKVQ
jgi:hypothetical protein